MKGLVRGPLLVEGLRALVHWAPLKSGPGIVCVHVYHLRCFTTVEIMEFHPLMSLEPDSSWSS